MNSKGFILTILLFAFTYTFAEAQGTARATMKVSVKVVQGVSTTVDTQSSLIFSERGIKGELASVTINGAEDRQILVSSDSDLQLVNQKGHKVMVPVSMTNRAETERLNLQFLSEYQSLRNEQYTGEYAGTLETTIEYY